MIRIAVMGPAGPSTDAVKLAVEGYLRTMGFDCGLEPGRVDADRLKRASERHTIELRTFEIPLDDGQFPTKLIVEGPNAGHALVPTPFLESFKGRVRVRALITRVSRSQGEMVLISRDKTSGDLWELPGGGLLEGETVKEALIRELKEELGDDGPWPVGRLLYTEQYEHRPGEGNSLLLVFEVPLFGLWDFVFGEEIAETRWVTARTIKEVSLYPNCQRAVDQYFK